MLAFFFLLWVQTPWPSFRGPERNGSAPDVRLPASFDPDLDRLWRRELSPGHSSPVLAGNAIYLTVRREGEVFTVCCDVDDGHTLWERLAPAAALAQEPQRNEDPALFAASTPVTDGLAVFVSLPEYGLVAYELSGEERWRLPLDRQRAPYPSASSPALVRGRLIHLCDHDGESFLVAVDTEDGNVLWKAERPFATHGYSSPSVLGNVVVVSGSHRVDAYDLDTGRNVWWALGLAWQSRATPVGGDGVVFVQSAVRTMSELGLRTVSETWDEALTSWDRDGDRRLLPGEITKADVPGEWMLHDLDGDGALDAEEWERIRARTRSGSGLWALRLGGSGDVSESQVLWTRTRRVPLTTTPLLVGGTLVTVRDGGLAIGIDPNDGSERWSTRIDGMRSSAFSSPVSIGGSVLTIDQDGTLAILDPRDGRVLDTHDLGEEVWATPAIGREAFYVRTTEALHAFRLGTTPLDVDTLAFVGVDVLTMDARGTLRDQTVIVREGRVLALGPRDQTALPTGTEVLARGPGWTVLPGLVDSWARVEDEHELLRHLLAGVTTLRTFGGRPELLALRERVRSGTVPGPEWVIGAPALRARLDPVQAVLAIDASVAAGYDFASAEVGLEPRAWLAASERARELGLPFAGARPPDLDLADVLAAEPWTLDRMETLVGETDLLPALSLANVAVTPLLGSHSMSIEAASHRHRWIEDNDALRDVSPIVRVLWSPAAHALQRRLRQKGVREQRLSLRAQREAVRTLDLAGVDLLAGSDAISPFLHPGQALHRELSVLAGLGLSAEGALRAATATPGRVLARVLGESQGTVAVGAPAHLILVAGDPLQDLRRLEHPRGTMVAGCWYRRGALETALQGARAIYERETAFVKAVVVRRPTGTAALTSIFEELETYELDLRESTVRRLIQLLLHPRVARVEDAAALAAFADHRWPVDPTPGPEQEPER